MILGNLFCRFLRDRHGATSLVFTLSMIPVSIGAGAAFDMTEALRLSTRAQTAIDAAVLSAVQLDSSRQNSYAQSLFASQIQYRAGETGTPTFTNNADGSLTGSVTVTMPTTILKVVGKLTVNIAARATASKPVEDTSCILTLAGGLTVGTDALTVNGGPKLDLTSCTLRSNASMKCNGNDGDAIMSIAVGSVTGCNNPQTNSLPVPDIHAALKSNIQKQCSTMSGSITWNVGTLPSALQLKTIVNAQGITEYHLCGNVTVKGTGALLGSSSADSILVIENGSFTLANSADVSLTRTTMVLTATDTTKDHFIDFPQGKGMAATLRLSPSQSASNPWQGIGIYQDPDLTTNINTSWGPAASFYVDGVVYFPNASFSMSGNGNSNNSNCTKFVTRDFLSNGAINWKQTTAGCAAIGIKQYHEASRLLS